MMDVPFLLGAVAMWPLANKPNRDGRQWWSGRCGGRGGRRARWEINNGQERDGGREQKEKNPPDPLSVSYQ